MDKSLRGSIQNKEAKIAVIGLGYVGLPLAIEFVRSGYTVVGVEIDKDRLGALKNKKSYITDVPVGTLRKAFAAGRFSAQGSFSAIRDCRVVLICVPTPLKRKYYPNISYIRKAVGSIANNINKPSLIVLESTTYPGTTEEIILKMLEKKGLRHGEDFYLCFSPERIDPGNKTFPLRRIPKVIGGIDKEATSLGLLLYRNIVRKVIPVSSTRSAEAVKLLENTYRLVNIALINELAMMANEMGIGIWEVIRAASTKPFGFMPFYPGPGVGGHCIPKDPLYLYWKARHHGFKSRFIKLASDIIAQMPGYIVRRLSALIRDKYAKELPRSKILVVGITYKKDIRDLRKSPSLDIIELLQTSGAEVSYLDPLIPYLKFGAIGLKSISLNKRSLAHFDCVLIATDHSCLDYKFLLDNSRMVFDLRNVYADTNNPKVFRL